MYLNWDIRILKLKFCVLSINNYIFSWWNQMINIYVRKPGKLTNIIQIALTLCTLMSSVTQHQFLSQKLLCRVPFDILSRSSFFVKRAKENQDYILEIVSRYIIHLKMTKYNNSVNKTGI